jgi:hypothetical protein
MEEFVRNFKIFVTPKKIYQEINNSLFIKPLHML